MDQSGEAGSGGARGGYCIGGAGGRLYRKKRDVNGNAVCDRERGAYDGMGDCERER